MTERPRIGEIYRPIAPGYDLAAIEVRATSQGYVITSGERIFTREQFARDFEKAPA